MLFVILRNADIYAQLFNQAYLIITLLTIPLKNLSLKDKSNQSQLPP